MFFCAMLVLLTGCEKTVVESQSIQTYTIVDIKRPKHFRISLKDNTGRIFKDVAVSKHCNRWREVKVGTVVQLNTMILKKAEERWMKIQAQEICPRT